MALSDQRTKSAKMAADLIRRGIFHGKRTTKPYPNSGGTTLRMNVTGSSKYQRLTGQ